MKKLYGSIAATLLTINGIQSAEPVPEIKIENTQIIQANAFLKNGELEQAISKLDSILLADPDNARALRLRGNVHFEMKNYDAALEDFTEVIKLMPRNAKAYFDRGVLYLAMNNDREAFDDIERAFVLNPKLAESLESKPNIGEKIHALREKAHKAKVQVKHKNGVINTKKGGLIMKAKKS